MSENPGPDASSVVAATDDFLIFLATRGGSDRPFLLAVDECAAVVACPGAPDAAIQRIAEVLELGRTQLRIGVNLWPTLPIVRTGEP